MKKYDPVNIPFQVQNLIDQINSPTTKEYEASNLKIRLSDIISACEDAIEKSNKRYTK